MIKVSISNNNVQGYNYSELCIKIFLQTVKGIMYVHSATLPLTVYLPITTTGYHML